MSHDQRPNILFILADEREARDLIDKHHPLQDELCRSMQEQVRQAGAVPWQKKAPESKGPLAT